MIVNCPQCGTKHTIQKIDPNSTYYCTKCNSIIMSGGKLRIASGGSAQVEIKTKYYALRIIANILQIFAYIVGIVGVIVSIVVSYGSYGITRFLSGTGAVGSLLIAVGGIVFSVIVFIAILARAEQIKLFIDIEENTRAIELNTRPKNSQ